MKLENITLKGFRCFDSNGTTVQLQECITTFVGGNGTGKTALLLGLSRLFGIAAKQRIVQPRDFHCMG